MADRQIGCFHRQTPLHLVKALTKHRPENFGQRASSAALGCLRLEQQNSWNLALQNVEQLKWILSLRMTLKTQNLW